jgi:hypothetical protein
MKGKQENSKWYTFLRFYEALPRLLNIRISISFTLNYLILCRLQKKSSSQVTEMLISYLHSRPKD